MIKRVMWWCVKWFAVIAIAYAFGAASVGNPCGG
jgi:hypothetical protein